MLRLKSQFLGGKASHCPPEKPEAKNKAVNCFVPVKLRQKFPQEKEFYGNRKKAKEKRENSSLQTQIPGMTA